MHKPTSYLARMTIMVILIGLLTIFLYPDLRQAFIANALINSVIAAVGLVGIIYLFRQIFRLYPEISWIKGRSQPPTSATPKPRLLASIAAILDDHRDNTKMSALSVRSLLDSIAARLEESRELSRYLIGLLIFLGLLGTFWGLLQTIWSIGSVLDTLSFDGQTALALDSLRDGLSKPLAGMGTAFSSSLFGLAGALLLGFLDLQVSQAQNHFFNDLEEWFAGQTTLGREQSLPAYLEALMEQTSDNLDKLARSLQSSDQRQDAVLQALENLNNHNKKIADSLDKVAQEQSGVWQKTIRDFGQQMGHLLKDQKANQTDIVETIRDELRLVARTIAAKSK